MRSAHDLALRANFTCIAYLPTLWLIWFALTFLGWSVLAAGALGQTPEVPRLLPELVDPILDQTVAFDPNLISIRGDNGRFQLWADKQLLKDFGSLKKEAEEAVRVIRHQGICRYGVIAGSQPAFEFWLTEYASSTGKPELAAPRSAGGVRHVIPFEARNLRIEQVSGVWCIRDGGRILYNFGREADAAKNAFAICKRFGFNQIGVIGTPNAVMTMPMLDPYEIGKVKPANALELANSIANLGLTLPQIGYVGSSTKLDHRKLDMAKDKNDWLVVHGNTMLASFGPDEQTCRTAVRTLQDWKVSEVIHAGKSGFPIYLSNGQPPRSVPLGVNYRTFQVNLLRAQQSNGSWWIAEGNRPILDCGTQEDATLMLKVMQHYNFDTLARIGSPLRENGLRLLVKSR